MSDRVAKLCRRIAKNARFDKLIEICIPAPGTLAENELFLVCQAFRKNNHADQVRIWRGSVVNAAGAKHIADMLLQNATITNLDINGNRIEDKGYMLIAKALTTNSTLKILNLDYCDFVGLSGCLAMADMLRQNVTLMELRLWAALAASQADECAMVLAEALKFNNSLRKICLQSNNIHDEGAKAFADLLSTNPRLETLNLSYNDISNSGILLLISALMQNRKLKELRLRENATQLEGLSSIPSILSQNRGLCKLQIAPRPFGLLITEAWKQLQLDIDQVLSKNQKDLQHRVASCRDVLTAFLGIRKLRRMQSGMWVDAPRDILKLIALDIWEMATGQSAVIRVCKKRRYPQRTKVTKGGK